MIGEIWYLVNDVGVDSVGIEGDDRVVVIGNGVDATKLTICMRKKVGHTDLISVAEVK